ncbi:hypothetical protein B0J11DRAFT_435299 [Dendryphion nanum]|uniref:Uncharacterized protein n=1 Tax=Dendryphion nanum TaxID=256645 RepID=A0A9P9IK74_9PLEO|nr:hypothetical protein B0J11DRAFT_435299 [Dendryphion nanum]
MFNYILGFFSICTASAYVVPSPTPSITTIVHREEATAIPTFTFGPNSRYFPPEPSGDSLQIYPTGLHEDLPHNGIDIILGPDLRKRIKETMQRDCKDKPQEQCRDSLIPIFHNTDVSKHTKRFLLVGGAIIAGLVALVVAQAFILLGESGYLATDSPPKRVNLNYADLHQIQSIGSVSKLAYVTGSVVLPTTITMVQPTATPTHRTFASVETLISDRDGHKAGDIVFHIPESVAARMYDYLAMIGSSSARDDCAKAKGKRRDISACYPIVQQYAQALNAELKNIVEISKEFIPGVPAPGQPIKFPVPNLKIADIPMAISIARKDVLKGANVPEMGKEFDIAFIAAASLAITVVLHVVMGAGTRTLDFYTPKDMVLTDLKEEDIECPEEIMCIDNTCGAQIEFTQMPERRAICPKGKYEGCRCNRVLYPYHANIPAKQMDQQYDWLQQLIKHYENPPPPFKITCEADREYLSDSKLKFQK